MPLFLGSTKVALNMGDRIGTNVVNQSKSITPTKSAQTLTPDPGYTGMSQVVVNAIPNSYIVPSGTFSVYSDGIHSGASAYSQVEVDTLSKFRTYIRDGMISNWYKSTTITDENITGIGIGRMAQIVNYSIVSLNLPNCSVISAYGLYNNPSLIGVSLPNLKTLIGEKIFASCSSLTSINLPSLSLNNIVIAPQTFENCRNLTDVSFGPSVTAICTSMFALCSKLTNITTNNIVSIGNSAFYSCKSLTHLSFPELSSINSTGIFYGCGIESFTDINFPKLSMITTQAYDFLNYCSNLSIISFSKTITLQGGWTMSPASYIFNQFSLRLKTIYFENINAVNAPQMFNFNGGWSIDLVDIGFSGITALGSNLFQFPQGSLSSTRYINTVRFRNVNLGQYFFFHAKYINHIDLPNATYISTYTCTNNENLLTISIPSVTSIYDYAFSNCYLLNSVYAPMCNYIAQSAFANCSSLTSIDLPSIRTIGYSAFAGCINLSSINMPLIQNISAYAFSGTLISALSLNNCYSLQQSAFTGMSLLEKLYINYPSSGSFFGSVFGSSTVTLSYTYPLSIISGTVQYIYSFSGSWFNTYLPNLKTISLNCWMVNGYAFSNNTILETLYLNGVSHYSNPNSFGLRIGQYAFRSCSNLTNISLNNLAYMDGSAFENVKASSIYINTASTFTYINTSAFKNCSNLNTIVISGAMSSNARLINNAFATIPQLYSLTLNLPSVIRLENQFSLIFNDTPYYSTTTYWSGPDPKIYVPASLVEAYKSAQYWSEYSSYITAIV